MADNIVYCQCGFKFVESMLSKTKGICPVCKKGRKDLKVKYGDDNYA